MGATGSDIKQLISTASPTCNGISNILSSLSCTYLSNTRILTISNGFSSDTSGAVTFSILNVLNPPNSISLTGFTINLVTTIGNIYEQSNSFSLKVTTPNTISINNGGISSTIKTVSTAISLGVSFTIKNPMASGYLVQIIVPPEMTVSPTAIVIGQNGVRTITLTCTISGNTILITNGYTAYSSATFL